MAQWQAFAMFSRRGISSENSAGTQRREFPRLFLSVDGIPQELQASKMVNVPDSFFPVAHLGPSPVDDNIAESFRFGRSLRELRAFYVKPGFCMRGSAPLFSVHEGLRRGVGCLKQSLTCRLSVLPSRGQVIIRMGLR